MSHCLCCPGVQASQQNRGGMTQRDSTDTFTAKHSRHVTGHVTKWGLQQKLWSTVYLSWLIIAGWTAQPNTRTQAVFTVWGKRDCTENVASYCFYYRACVVKPGQLQLCRVAWKWQNPSKGMVWLMIWLHSNADLFLATMENWLHHAAGHGSDCTSW